MRLIHQLVLTTGLLAAAASAQTTVTVLQGNGQLVPANLGEPSKPIVFQATNNGVPAPGVHLHISNSLGLVYSPLSSSDLVTDSNGLASTYFLPGTLTTAQDINTFFFTAASSLGGSASFVETAYYVSLALQQGVGVYRLAPNPALLNPLTGAAGVPTVPFTVQVLATAGSQSGLPVPNVGVHVILTQNPAPAGTPVQVAYCVEGQGPEHRVFTNSSGLATCTPVFALPNASLNSSYDNFTFMMAVGDFNDFGPFGYNITPAPLVLTNPGTQVTLSGQAFSKSLSASGGIAPYTFGLSSGSGALPGGLQVSAAGLISGIPSTPGLYHVILQVTDKLSAVTTTSVTFAVSGGPLQVIPPVAPVLNLGSPFDLTFRVSGGVPPYNLSLTSALPAGVTFTKSDSVGDTFELKGSIATAGNYSFGVVATDAVGTVSAIDTFSLTVAPSLVFNPVTLPSGTVGQPFGASLNATGGQAPYVFGLAPGSNPLPAGLSLSSSGMLSGTPASASIYNFTVQVTDVLHNLASAPVTLSISGGTLQITAPPSPSIAPGGSVDLLFHTSGGVPPYTQTLTGAWLPAGATFLKTSANGDTYELKGVFPGTGTFNLSVIATDALGRASAAAPVTVTVTAPLTFTASALPLGTVGQAYSATLTANGGMAPLTYKLGSGALPGGLALAANGILSGTPTTPGQTTFSVTVTDALSQTANAQYALTISGGPLTIAGPSVLSPAIAGTALTQTFAANGGVPPYTFKFEGAPPPGLTLSAGGVLNGNLALTGTRVFTIDVTDANSNTARAQIQLPVVAPPPAVLSVTNGASFSGGSIAPGEIISLFGANLGPATPAGLTLDSTGKVATSLGGVQVLVDGIAAPLLYVSSGQINLVVPFGAIDPSSTITVVYQGQTSAAVPMVLRSTDPGIFTLGGTQAAVLNQDLTVNAPAKPAARGSVIAIYVTGAGQTTPPTVDGQVPTTASTSNIAGLTVTIGGQTATVNYSGVAPGLVAGAVQINVTIPTNAPTGSAIPITFSVGSPDNASQTATIAIQ